MSEPRDQCDPPADPGSLQGGLRERNRADGEGPVHGGSGVNRPKVQHRSVLQWALQLLPVCGFRGQIDFP